MTKLFLSSDERRHEPYHIDLRELQRNLGGEIRCRRLHCPGPNHGRKDRSLVISVGPEYPDGFFCKTFSPKDDDLFCKDWVIKCLGLPPRHTRSQSRRRVADPIRPHHHEDETKKRIELAQEIWNEGQDPRGTLAEEYLAARKLHLPAEICGSALRFHAECLWGNERIPCMIAGFTEINGDNITGIHRIRLDQPDRWPAADRMMLGAVTGSAIKFDAAGNRLAIGEGIETALAARQLGFGECWALGSACQIAKFQPVDGIKTLTLLGEHCDVNRKAAEECSRLWVGQGREVFLALPRTGKDFNDFLGMELR